MEYLEILRKESKYIDYFGGEKFEKDMFYMWQRKKWWYNIKRQIDM